MNTNMELLRTHSVFWSKLGYCYDPPRKGPDGKYILFASDFDRFTRIQADFAKAGIKIFSSILFNGWVGVDQYDYELTDQVLAAVFEKTPDILYIPRIKLNVPLEWCKANPEELFVYYDGPRDAEGIRALVETPRHDILGYNSPHGYGNTFGYQDDRPNVGGLISLQSFSSKKWLADASEALRRIIERLENGPYADRIPAYHIAYGACGETCLWGRCGHDEGDFGIANRRAFFDWAVKRHGSVETLRKAWACPDITRDHIEPPSPERRKSMPESLQTLLRDESRELLTIDYDRFMSDVNVDAMEHFGRITKELTGGKPVGYFYGYVLECDNAAYTGWLGYDRVLNSPYIDFIAAPKSYYRNGPNEPGGILGIAQSFNRKKLWMDEIDNHTHLVPGSSCKSFEDTRKVLWREFAKNLSLGSNFWWMDLGGGWYDSPGIMKEIAVMEKLAAKLRQQPRTSIAQTLLIVDEESICHTSQNGVFHRLLLQDMVREFNSTGGVVDIYRLSDLAEMDLSQYRLVVPLHTFALTSQKWDTVRARLAESATILWCYAPGAIAGGTVSLANIDKLTGFSLIERGTAQAASVLFDGLPSAEWASADNNPVLFLEIIPKENQAVIGSYSGGGAAVVAEGRSIYCAAPILKAEHLRSIMEAAGCHLYAPSGTVIYGDNRFIALFNGTDTDFELLFPSPHDVIGVVTGESYRQAESIRISMAERSMSFFIIGEG